MGCQRAPGPRQHFGGVTTQQYLERNVYSVCACVNILCENHDLLLLCSVVSKNNSVNRLN